MKKLLMLLTLLTMSISSLAMAGLSASPGLDLKNDDRLIDAGGKNWITIRLSNPSQQCFDIAEDKANLIGANASFVPNTTQVDLSGEQLFMSGTTTKTAFTFALTAASPYIIKFRVLQTALSDAGCEFRILSVSKQGVERI